MPKAKPGSPLAAARRAAHARFDPLWKSGRMTRSQAYAWLAKALSMPPSQCHMYQMSMQECANVITVCDAANTPTEHELVFSDFEDLDA